MQARFTTKLPSDFILKAIVAIDEARVIGNKGSLPWHIPEDMKYFAGQTKGHTVLMGRKTYESLPDQYRPLPNRINVVLSRSTAPENLPESVFYFKSPEDFFRSIESAEFVPPSSTIWLLGGADLYRQLLGICGEVHITRVPGKHEGDAFLQVFEDSMELFSRTEGDSCTWEVYKPISFLK